MRVGKPVAASADAADASAVGRERDFWEQHEEFEWMAEESKRDVVGGLPAFHGDVLELCVGSGMLTTHIPRTYRSYVGLDLSGRLLHALHHRAPDVRLVQGNAQAVCFADRSFDAVVVFAGLHHLPSYPTALAEASRVLRPGGVFLCLEPNSRAWYRTPMEWLRDWIGIYSDDEVFLDPREVRRHMEEVGLGDVREQFLTPRFSRAFLTPKNRILAQLLYAGAALGTAEHTQSFFLLSGRKA